MLLDLLIEPVLRAHALMKRDLRSFFILQITIYDGGSIRYESFVYSALESRRREAAKDENGNDVWRAGYQGFTWSWKHLNTLWIIVILATSFLISFIRRHPINAAEQAEALKP